MSVRCSFEDCKCAVITVDSAIKVQLPGQAAETFQLMRGATATSEQNEFLLVKDVWDFDNVGVSKQIPPGLLVDSDRAISFVWENKPWTIEKCLKYLICAECDKGPIGMVCQVKNDHESTTLYLLSLSSLTV
ncbi:hypothetical protein HG536_0G03900 [Torulaspora globosa]|uniref:Protein DSS4 n=1 Tax=Torulaspora globosa TaxID=48254 RepID=A0A7G3ZLZ2_9SACH|nr:uncharacterized protein HG536_0G03900 [Torulaspora globosa]QLL34528.1 hypothetical protein HG536_0G03900 [Torulaspora globosa]